MMHVMATGTGKTIVFAKLYEAMKSRLPGQMLVISHRDELVEQNADKAKGVNPSLKIGMERGGDYCDPQNDDIISASVQTLGRKGTTRLEKLNWERIDKLVIDEAHHGTSDGYTRVIERFSILGGQHSPRLLLGVTATPNRPDGAALSDVFEKVAYTYGIRQAIKDGWLVDLRGYRVSTETSLEHVSTSDGDFVKSELSRAINTQDRNDRIVSAWLKLGENRQTMAFTVDINHATELADAFKVRGVNADATWGEDPDRKRKLEDHRAGKINVLCNCNLYVEGYDDWRVSCLILARPTESDVLYTQMVGRGTRLQENTGNLIHRLIDLGGDWESIKRDCTVIDVVDNSSKHSLLTLPTLMGLSKDLNLKGQSLLNTVEALEKLQEDNPHVDFTKLEYLDGAKTLIESVDLFQIRFPKEVEENSELMWFRAIDGGFKMRIPAELGKPGFVKVFENAIGKWDVVGQINEDDFHGTRPTMEETFKVADEQIRKRVHKMTLSKVLRSAAWHKNPVSRGQKTMLERLFPYKQFNYSLMTQGDASRVISERLSRRK
jgi:ATP-dependent helicase IRC3